MGLPMPKEGGGLHTIAFDSDGMRHSAKLAWRSLALLQLELEADAELGRPKTLKPQHGPWCVGGCPDEAK